jgi:DNA-binding transcriptional LysR family regulator
MADRRLVVFHTAARTLSFTKAAEALRMSQPAVTFQVRQLEEHFNTRLIDRAHHGLRLTEAGQRVFTYADQILALNAEMEEAVQAVTGVIGGVLLLGASTTIAEYLLPSLLGRFKQAYPKLNLRLWVGNTERIVALVKADEVDLGIVEGPVVGDKLAVAFCHMDELVVVASPGHAFAQREHIRPAELFNHPFIAREVGSGTREVITTYLKAVGLNPADLDIAMELGGPEAIKQVVSTGLGLSVLSRATIAKERRLNQLVTISLEPPLRRPLSFVYRKTRSRLRAAEALMTLAHEHCELTP